MGGGGANPDPATARIRFRKGDAAGRLDYVAENGEPLWDSDNNLYVGDGVTPGGVYVGRDASKLTQGTLATARGGTGVTTGLTQINAGNLNAGTVPDARLAAAVARTGVAQTWTAAQTFNAGIKALGACFAWKLDTSSSSVTNVAVTPNDFFLSWSCSNASYGVQYTLPSVFSVPTGQMFVFQCRAGSPAGTNTVTAASGQLIVGGVGSVYTLPNSVTKAVWFISVGDAWQTFTT